ncbi:hypothetical protein GW17_00042069 [Ensete ventricosum]|nr:hypothetical protein GW17_00042069 [Ensete ventricosum]
MQSTIERYREHLKEDTSSTTMEQDAEVLTLFKSFYSLIFCSDTVCNQNKILWAYINRIECRKLLGEKLESCSLEELHELEGTIEQSLRSIRGRKASRLLNISYHLLREKISQLKEKVKITRSFAVGEVFVAGMYPHL